jgi:hypothetical protein
MNCVSSHGTIKFISWTSERASFFVNIEKPLAGLNVNSFLGRGLDAIQRYALDIFFEASYFACRDLNRTLTFPYPLSIRELHCGCCKWDSGPSYIPRSHHVSARASSCPGTLMEYSTFFTTSKEAMQSLLIPQSCIHKHKLVANLTSKTVRSGDFVMNAGATTTIWCGIWKNDHPLIARAIFSLSSVSVSKRHTEIMKCEDPHIL